MFFLKQRPKCIISLLLVLIGIVLLTPYANYQDFLSQGDHGRDLYAAQAVYRGELPYKDFWWVYGPLMPYYYGLFFKILGTRISSIIIGKLLLKILGGILICAALMEVSSTTAAFICACWFMLFQQDFFFTYNHLGGIVMILGVSSCLLSYIRKKSSLSAWGALLFSFILCLIKVNFGLAALAVSFISIAVTDFVHYKNTDNPPAKIKRCPYFYAVGLIGLPLVVFIIYYALLKGLSVTEIRQCLPYMEGDQPYTMNPLIAIVIFLGSTLRTITSNWTNLTFALIINASALRCFYLFASHKIPNPRKTILLLSLGMLGLFYAANFHEYLKSGVWYRGFWSQPLSMMISFILIDIAAGSIPKIARGLLFSFMALLALFSWYSVIPLINASKTESHFLSLPRGNIYVTNTPSWIQTVRQTTEFLNKTLKPHELFFALPYDCLYYYLTDKRTPTRQLIFFKHIKITPPQEKSVIAQLEKNHVNYVLISNRSMALKEPGLGVFGKDYCPLIEAYIEDHFDPIAKFGDWTGEPGWAWNHGTVILKRKGTP